MLIHNRLFEKQEPNRDAKCIYIFCEGRCREPDYFHYFQEKSSRLKVEVYEFGPEENNSPRGLMDMAKKCFYINDENLSVKYERQEQDEVWIVLDTDQDKRDSRRSQIDEVKKFCTENKGWNLVESNPCFEVWLYYHQSNVKAAFEGDESCKSWKPFVHQLFKGGFDSRKHPLFIESAIHHAKKNYTENKDGHPEKSTTSVFLLGNSLFYTLKNEIDKPVKKHKELTKS